MNDSLRILYRGVEMRALYGFDAFFQAYGGDAGIEAFCKLVKGHVECCRTIQSVFHDRAEAEEQYGAKLKKLSLKLSTAVDSQMGTVAESFQVVAACMSQEAKQHTQLSELLSSSIAQNLKNILKSADSTLKNVEKQVEKMIKKLGERRSDVKTAKKKCFQRVADGKKDTAKADGEFYNKALKAENTRAELELLILKTVAILQSLEKLRLSEMHNYCVLYYNRLAEYVTRMSSQIHEMEPIISASSVDSDLMQLTGSQGVGQKYVEQILVDFPAEEMNVSMDKTARVALITQYLSWAKKCLENNDKTQFDLLAALKRCDLKDPKSLDTVEATRNQLIMCSSMQDYMQACEWKFGTLLSSLNNVKRPEYKYAQHVVRGHDSSSGHESILRLPRTAIIQVVHFIPSAARAPGQQADTFVPYGNHLASGSHTAQRPCELSFNAGDVVCIVLPWDKTWWLAVMGNRVGEVPSQYFLNDRMSTQL